MDRVVFWVEINPNKKWLVPGRRWSISYDKIGIESYNDKRPYYTTIIQLTYLMNILEIKKWDLSKVTSRVTVHNGGTISSKINIDWINY